MIFEKTVVDGFCIKSITKIETIDTNEEESVSHPPTPFQKGGFAVGKLSVGEVSRTEQSLANPLTARAFVKHYFWSWRLYIGKAIGWILGLELAAICREGDWRDAGAETGGYT